MPVVLLVAFLKVLFVFDCALSVVVENVVKNFMVVFFSKFPIKFPTEYKVR